tara:strand:- start:303 stop:596 length:294 start_codon:yes stop_codon:yes gene_type:complete
MSLQLNKHSTEFTSFDDHVFVDGKHLKREKVWYKQFTSEAQAEKVLEELIVNNNFYPDFTRSKVVEFSNPTDPQVKYYYYPTTFEVEKVKLYVVDSV